MANPVSSVSSALQAEQVASKVPVQNAQPSPRLQVVPQDSVSISQSGKVASQAQAASKSAQPSDADRDGDSK